MRGTAARAPGQTGYSPNVKLFAGCWIAGWVVSGLGGFCRFAPGLGGDREFMWEWEEEEEKEPQKRAQEKRAVMGNRAKAQRIVADSGRWWVACWVREQRSEIRGSEIEERGE